MGGIRRGLIEGYGGGVSRMGACVAGEWGATIVGVVVFCLRGGRLRSFHDPSPVNAVLKIRHERIFLPNNIPGFLAPGTHVFD